MQKFFHFDSPGEPYTCDAAVVACIDNRFSNAWRKFLKRQGVHQPDTIVVAGGAKALASPRDEDERSFVLEQLRTSQRLHGTRRVMLINHRDCGAYGGRRAFANPAQEAIFHEEQLLYAAGWLAEALPDTRVEAFYVDFDGVWKAEVRAESEVA
jgi:carbonic anhydrase